MTGSTRVQNELGARESGACGRNEGSGVGITATFRERQDLDRIWLSEGANCIEWSNKPVGRGWRYRRCTGVVTVTLAVVVGEVVAGGEGQAPGK